MPENLDAVNHVGAPVDLAFRPGQVLRYRGFDVPQYAAEQAARLEAIYREERYVGRVNRLNEIDMSAVEDAMKIRHLTKGERDQYHNPKPDWHDTPKGDMCKNACVLEVEDIIRKHIK